jgi:hypothetical protein
LKVSNQRYPLSLSKAKISNVANPDPGSGLRCLFDPWIWDLGYRIRIGDGLKVRIQIPDPDPGWKTRIIFLRAEKPFFLVKISKFFDADPGSRTRDGKNLDPGSGMEKNLIRDLG